MELRSQSGLFNSREHFHSLENFKSELQLFSSVEIPRHILTDNFLTCEIHGFAYASEKAYAAVVYLRVSDRSCNVRTFFVRAK